MQARMKATTKETRPTSMASNAQPMPEEALVAGELRGLR